MLGLSFGELLFIGVLALIVIGPKQLPEVARNLARLINDLKRSTESFSKELKENVQFDIDLNSTPKSPPKENVNKTVDATANIKIKDENNQLAFDFKKDQNS